MDFTKYWNNEYLVRKNDDYDNWLEKYNDIIDCCSKPVLDLGCGTGNDTKYLLSRDKDVLSCDISKVALERLKNEIPNSKILQLDMSKGFPFQDNSFGLIIANLSLHYFDKKTTEFVLSEIKRILTPNGTLIARVNSKNDEKHDFGKGTLIEEDFFDVGDCQKRFFDTNSALTTFSSIGQTTATETTKTRFGKSRKFIEIVCTNSPKKRKRTFNEGKINNKKDFSN